MTTVEDPIGFTHKLEGMLKKARLKVTHNRIRCLQTVLLALQPVRRKNIHSEFGPGGIDRTTLYRTMRTLEKAGLVRKHFIGDEEAWCAHTEQDLEKARKLLEDDQ